MASWEPVSLGSSLYNSPTSPVPTSTHGRLGELPFNDLHWEDFEKLQWRILKEVEGLTDTYQYGDRGQAQQGIDIIGFDPFNDGVALQSKNYKKFTTRDLKMALDEFVSTERPFRVTRLIIGVASPVKSTQVINELLTQKEQLEPITLELWDAVTLSEILREQPRIVIEFFGESTAQAFCYPYEFEALQIPNPNVVAVQEAIVQTPEEATGAQRNLDRAHGEENPEKALALVEEAQEKLREAGFSGHAQKYDHRRLALSAQVGTAEEAARDVLDGFWEAIELGQSSVAQQKQMLLNDFTHDAKSQHLITQYQQVMSEALDLYENPLGSLPQNNDLRIGDAIDQAYLFILAGETALANHQQNWLLEALPYIEELSGSPEVGRLETIRLRLLIAEATSEWTSLYDEAVRSRLGNGLGALVTARYARINALTQRFKDADALWSTASGYAALAQQWDLASTSVLSQRIFRSRWQPLSGNELLPLQLALKKMGSSKPMLRLSSSAHETAMTALRKNKLRPAAISAQKALRDAILVGDWYGENHSRELLGEILARAEEPELAARQFIRCGAVDQVVALAEEHANVFINLIDEMDAPNYWTVGTLYRLMAVQADLVPDDMIADVSQRVLKEIESAENRVLVDQSYSNTSRYRNALKLLACIANRLPFETADQVLNHFEKQPSLSEHQYRLHDEEEATSVAHIVMSHPDLAERGCSHLITLLTRSLRNHKELPLTALAVYPEYSQPVLEKLASENKRWAQELLVRMSLFDQPTTSDEALRKLAEPLPDTSDQYVGGTSAVSDSLLVHNADAKKVAFTIRTLLSKADAPRVNSLDRGEYLIAASNLVEHTHVSDRHELFELAIRLGHSPTPSEFDRITERYRHKLSFFRSTGEPQSARTKAALLAAKLVNNEEQRQRALDLTYKLLTETSDHWIARTLTELGGVPAQDLGFLASQGWQVRAVSARLWVEQEGAPYLGERLAQDADVRVRRALALAISPKRSDEQFTRIREILQADAAYSVRAALLAGRR